MPLPGIAPNSSAHGVGDRSATARRKRSGGGGAASSAVGLGIAPPTPSPAGAGADQRGAGVEDRGGELLEHLPQEVPSVAPEIQAAIPGLARPRAGRDQDEQLELLVDEVGRAASVPP